jgi:predicted RNA-binding Zn ribbon-like protein
VSETLNQLESTLLHLMRQHDGLMAGNEYLEALWLLGDDASVTKYICWTLFRPLFSLLVTELPRFEEEAANYEEEKIHVRVALTSFISEEFEGILTDRFFSDPTFTCGSLANAEPNKKRAHLTRAFLKRWADLWIENDKRLDIILRRFAEIRSSVEELDAAPRVTTYLGEREQASLRFISYKKELPPNAEAARLLVGLATCHRVDRIRVCERPGCARIYMQANDRSNRYYCSRRCGNRASRPAKVRSESQRLQAGASLLSEIPVKFQDASGHAARAWLKSRLRRGEGVTLNFLTRRLKAGLLSYPEWWTNEPHNKRKSQ